jgi:hypothetical protein
MFSRSEALERLEEELELVNRRLWDLEDVVRSFSQPFTPLAERRFVDAAQEIFSKNEERSRTKRGIDILISKESQEGKFYCGSARGLTPPSAFNDDPTVRESKP